MHSDSEKVIPIFVLGATRSGTTLIGKYIGNHREVLDFSEFFGHFFTHKVLTEKYSNIPSTYKEEYLKCLQKVSGVFAEDKTKKLSKKYYCDSTPWNLMSADALAKMYPNAIFVLCIRHYRGVIQSLERNYKNGYKWSGSITEERAELYKKFYSNVVKLPINRTVPINFDKLCNDPNSTLEEFNKRISRFGIDSGYFDKRVFIQSHATETRGSVNYSKGRPVLAQEVNNKIVFNPITSYDKSMWGNDIENIVRPIVESTERSLLQRFPEDYLRL